MILIFCPNIVIFFLSWISTSLASGFAIFIILFFLIDNRHLIIINFVLSFALLHHLAGSLVNELSKTLTSVYLAIYMKIRF